MNWTLEVVVVPVSDVDRAKDFYSAKLGFNVDFDTGEREDLTEASGGQRIVQLTPSGSGCSIVIGDKVGNGMVPGSLKGLQLVVRDIREARGQLLERGFDAGEIHVLGENPFPTPDPLDNVGFLFFDDLDGNGWAVQQISRRG